jgi:hypothetical protein
MARRQALAWRVMSVVHMLGVKEVTGGEVGVRVGVAAVGVGVGAGAVIMCMMGRTLWGLGRRRTTLGGLQQAMVAVVVVVVCVMAVQARLRTWIQPHQSRSGVTMIAVV